MVLCGLSLLRCFALTMPPACCYPRAFLVTCASDLFIKIWDIQNDWKNTKTFPGHEHTISSVRFMPGDQQVVSASRDRTIRIFDVASTYALRCARSRLSSLCCRHLVRTIHGHADWVRCVAPSDDGRLLASCSSDHVSLGHRGRYQDAYDSLRPLVSLTRCRER